MGVMGLSEEKKPVWELCTIPAIPRATRKPFWVFPRSDVMAHWGVSTASNSYSSAFPKEDCSKSSQIVATALFSSVLSGAKAVQTSLTPSENTTFSGSKESPRSLSAGQPCIPTALNLMVTLSKAYP